MLANHMSKVMLMVTKIHSSSPFFLSEIGTRRQKLRQENTDIPLSNTYQVLLKDSGVFSGQKVCVEGMCIGKNLVI